MALRTDLDTDLRLCRTGLDHVAAQALDRRVAVRGMDVMDVHLSGSQQIMIEVDTHKPDGLKDPELLQRMLALEERLRGLGVQKTMSITDLVRELNLRFHADDPDRYAIPEERRQVSQLLFLYSFQGGDLGLSLIHI